jgi:hypothetical protein
MSHLIRGLFDGDGCVYKSTTTDNGKEYVYQYISFTSGSGKFVDDLCIFLVKNDIHFTIGEDSRRKYCDNKTYYVKIYKKKDVQKLRSLMYDNCNDWKLQRKYDLFI